MPKKKHHINLDYKHCLIPDTRPEIEPCFWGITNVRWPIKGKTKPDLIAEDVIIGNFIEPSLELLDSFNRYWPESCRPVNAHPAIH